MRPRHQPDPALYEIRKEALNLLENQSALGHFDLYYGDASKVSEHGYVPYGWQFADEQVCIQAATGQSISCFGLLSRKNDFLFKTTRGNISTEFVVTFFEEFSWSISKPTVVVVDNAPVHTARKFKERLRFWQKRGLYIFYLPPFSPHLNIIERLWKELKQRWLKPQDYQSKDHLFYAVTLALAAVGNELIINFPST